MSLYRAFGLVLSAELDLPELIAASADVPVDVAIDEVRALPLPQADGAESLRVEIPRTGTFLIEHGARIRYLRTQDAPDERIRLYLLGSCMGAILQQRGYLVLHGNAISTDEKTCTILVGRSGAGKSTAAAWHFKRGDSIVADDVCAIHFDTQGRPRVIPAYPQIKLWLASAELLDLPTKGLRRVYERFDKFCLPLGKRFATEPRELTAVIELAPDHVGHQPLHGIEKLHCLMRHSYRYPFVERMGIAAQYRKSALRLAGAVEVGRGARRNLDKDGNARIPETRP